MIGAAARRDELYQLLGELPSLERPIVAEEIARQETRGYLLEKLVLDLNGVEPVPAYFVRPADASEPLPAVLYNHAHGADYVLGKDELLHGREIIHDPPYADVLTQLGYSALCIDAW